jgi:phosphoribosylanthranilate isomerase
MQIKMCGITNLHDAHLSMQQGAHLLGFNFYSKSPRYITQDKAKKIINQLSKPILKVGIFIDTSYDVIAQHMDHLELDLVQLYTPLKASQDFRSRVIFSLQAEKNSALPRASILNQYGYLLLDAPKTSDGSIGGTGRLANWTLAHQLARDHRLFLAGGLTADNVQRAISQVKPYAVDVASGTERTYGIKDEIKMKQFIEECKHDK